PEYPNFVDISEEVVQKIVTYLTTIPRYINYFIFILDRRQDTWGSVKTSLAHIAASCPENLQLVLVLRPSGFFQRAISDISFRFSQDDFILKLPVVMLSSVTELLKYIDDTHLTQEFGGTLEYCHNEWILFRTAIESFAVMVKEIAQMLQAFGTDLAEAELPDDLHSVEDLLITRTEKYNQLKEDVRRVIKEGDLLLTNLMEPLSNEPHTQDAVEKNGDRATVKRLLAQLHEMETAFDGFWEKHLLKLEQCLQLWRFEQAFQEVKMFVDCLAAEEGDIPEIGDNVAHTEQALRELSNLDERSQELVENAQHLVLQGDHLISNHHYAMDLIWEKCNELHHSCEDLHDEMRRKYITLNRSLELHTRLQQALDWCDEGAYLLASQSMDKCQSQEGAKRALQEIERFLENSTYYLQLCCHLILILYVEELHTILQGYRVEMDNPSMLHLLPSALQNKKEILFGNMSEIHDFHNINACRICFTPIPDLGLCFLARKANFQMYVKYCQNKPRSETLWRQCSDSVFFQECQRKLDHKLGLDSYLLKPIQRLTKYQLLLKELLKFSNNGDGIQELQEALEAMLNLLKSVNDSMHQIAITGYNGNLEDFGKVLMQGSFNVWINHKKGPTKMKDLARFKPMHRHLFLHERALLFCKKREEHGEGYDKAPSYSFKHYLKMNAVGITENVKGDIRKFEVWYSGREEVYLIQAPTVDVKLAWLNEIRKVLTNPEKLFRGALLFCVPLSVLLKTVFWVSFSKSLYHDALQPRIMVPDLHNG
uniref:MCF.2 cell line derived transforming sequence n=1 Tax=Callorhinchus milii TaxID=7868 RepID=A0A4W3ILM3_CALMI